MREKMYLKTGRHYKYDDFCHEQSLIFKTDSGLVIFNSCSHGGAANIINEVKEAFSNEHLRALLGGFHLFNKTEEEICNLAKLIEATGIEEVYTGHCTGDRAFEILHRELGDRVHQFYVGLDLEF